MPVVASHSQSAPPCIFPSARQPASPLSCVHSHLPKNPARPILKPSPPHATLPVLAVQSMVIMTIIIDLLPKIIAPSSRVLGLHVPSPFRPGCIVIRHSKSVLLKPSNSLIFPLSQHCTYRCRTIRLSRKDERARTGRSRRSRSCIACS